MNYDFNKLEEVANELISCNKYHDALQIYYFMSDGDRSLDGGYLAKRIAQCYRALNEKHAAYYWFGKAMEENPTINADCIEERNKLGDISIDYLLY